MNERERERERENLLKLWAYHLPSATDSTEILSPVDSLWHKTGLRCIDERENRSRNCALQKFSALHVSENRKSITISLKRRCKTAKKSQRLRRYYVIQPSIDRLISGN